MLEIAALAALALVAAAVSTVTSFGTSTIMVPVLALFYPFEAVPTRPPLSGSHR